MSKMTLIYYEDRRGKSDVKEFIHALSGIPKDKVFRAINPLVDFGLGSHLLNTKKLVGTPLWEVRVLGKDSIRIFFAVVVNGVVLVLHGFVKKTQKTPIREIRLAIKRLEDWKSRH